jgi:ribose transport system ATP-binding protein
MTSTAPSALPLLEVRHLSKRFGAIQALDNVNLRAGSGEVHGLLGANGAGKSTLIRLLAGVYPPDSGTILIDGNPVSIRSPVDATALGLNFIHQELNLVPKLTVLQNLTLGLPKVKYAHVFVNWRAMEQQVAWVVNRLRMRFSLRAEAGELSVADRWLVAIGKALLRKPRLICMDEPTASLSDNESQRLFTIVRELSSSGVTVLYVTHRLQEVLDLCSRATVFRDGKVVRSLTRAEMTRDVLIRAIVGADLAAPLTPVPPSTRDLAPVLEVRNLARRPAVRDVSFAVYPGEVIGLAGLVGAGRTEVARLIFGADRLDSGEIWLDGSRLPPLTPRRAVNRGIALVPEERRSQGLVLSESLVLNVNMASLEMLRRFPYAPAISKPRGRERTRKQIRALDIKAPSMNSRVSQLSGGNQQKVVVSKWLVRESRLLVLDEPTRGVDVSARAGIYQIIRRLAREGKAVIVISSDFDEFQLCCDRVLVMAEGRIVGSVEGHQISETRLMELSYGGVASR